MRDPFAHLSDEDRAALTDEAAPAFAPPMLAVLVHDAFSSPDWIFERKLDGERCVAVRDGDLNPRGWTVANLRRRLGQKDDPWAGMGRHAVRVATLRRALEAGARS